MCEKILVLDAWDPLRKQLNGDGHSLVPIADNLVDVLWKDKPNRPSDPVIIHPLKFAGGNLLINFINVIFYVLFSMF